TRTQIIQSIDGTLNNHASLLAGRLGFTLSSVVNTLSPLRQNALVLNSLMDSLTRNTSLQPFLQDFSTVNGVPVEIALTDFEGKTIAGARSIPDMTIRWRKAVLGEGVPYVSIERSSSRVYLFIAEPVFYMRTLSPEGALIYGIDLTRLVADFNAAGGVEPVRLMQHGEPVLNDQQAEDSKQQARPMLTQTHPLDMSGLLAPLGLAVELSTDPEAMTRPLHELTLVYLYLGLAVLGAVTVLSTIAARRIARPLWELEHVAAAVVTSGSLDHRFRGGGYTEVARLGQTFNQMLERLGEAYTASEQQATAARRSEQRYRSIFDTTTAAILELDIDPLLKALAALRQAGITDLPAYLTGHPELLRGTARDVLIVDGNHAALEMFGASDPGELRGPLERMLLPESYAMLHALAMAVEEGLGSLGMEVALRSLGGATRHVMLGAHVPNRLTQPAPMLLSLVDISSRKAVERELLRTNNMLHAVGDALHAYITGGEHPESDPFDNLLTKLLESTDSEYGFIGEIH
ncbi:MAG: HAMP domain-containing protein, partial [Sedimenticolaceae bacterium]